MTEVRCGFLIYFGSERLRGYDSFRIDYMNLYYPSSPRFCVVAAGYLRATASLNARFPVWRTKARRYRRCRRQSYTHVISRTIPLVLGIPLFLRPHQAYRYLPCRNRRCCR
jgi:hypothetical protein